MKYRTHFLAANLLLFGCSCSHLPPGDRSEASGPGIEFRYPNALYVAPECKTLPKKTSADQVFPFGGGPKRWTILLKSRPAFQDFTGIIYLTPLSDRTVRHFDEAYVDLSRNVHVFRAMFDGQREDFSPWLRVWGEGIKSLPDEPWCDAGEGLHAKFRLLDSPQISGFRVLVYYAQGVGDVLEKDNLLYNFQGITKDGRYYLSARLGLRNPALDRWKPTTGESQAEVEGEQRHVNSWKADSFVPTLGQLDQMIESIELTIVGAQDRLIVTNTAATSEEIKVSFPLK